MIGSLSLYNELKTKKFKIVYDLKILPIVILVGAFFRIFHFSNWIIESHDILYFSPAIEMLNSTYFGNLKVPYYYPYELSANHLTPAGFLVSVGFF